MRRILVFGATGYSGRMVVAELARQGQPIAIADRDRGRLDALYPELGLPADVPCAVADVLQPASLPPLFAADVGAVINCAGPFTLLGEPVVAAAIAAGAHYLDLSGEPPYLARIVDRYAGPAQARGCAVIPACGVEYALANWVAALAARGLEPVDHLWTAFGLIGSRPSKGTQRSFFVALAQPGVGWRGGRRVPYPPGRTMRWVTLPSPFGRRLALSSPLGELLTIPRHVQVTTMDSYLALPAAPALALRMLSPFLPVLAPGAGRVLEPLTRNPPPDYVERSQCAVVAQARSRHGRRRVVVQGRQVYRLAAAIVCWCAMQTLAPAFTAQGVLGPAEAFDPATALPALARYGVRYGVWPAARGTRSAL
ncbi:MAG TPA: saccharopine dehydrogenase NADP-binding domain-containing protein [Chloroflexia bacterium]|nr:saccharopine dehydrogenase NADP-binding domain-containing protein [Chloroflexia bacterium]